MEELKVLIEEEKIQQRVKEIAEQNVQPQSQTSSLGRSTDNAPTNMGGENTHLEPS